MAEHQRKAEEREAMKARVDEQMHAAMDTGMRVDWNYIRAMRAQALRGGEPMETEEEG